MQVYYRVKAIFRNSDESCNNFLLIHALKNINKAARTINFNFTLSRYDYTL